MTTRHAPAHPAQHAPAPPSVPTGLALATQVVAALWVLLSCGRLIAVALADDVSGLEPALHLTSAGSLVQLVAWGVGGTWLYLVAAAGRRLRPDSWHERATYWAVVGWVVPVVNLWFPYQFVRDGAAAVRAGTRVVGWWWATWLVAGLLTGVEGYVLTSVVDDTWTLLAVTAAGALATVVSGALWVRVVRSMTDQAAALRDTVLP
jgi:hypothetical protein